MFYQLAADAIVLIHFGFILYVVLGGLLSYKWLYLSWLHLPAVIWGVVMSLAGWICPLTPLENKLRAASGGGRYSSGFIEHYILPVIYPAGLDRELQTAMGIALLVVNALVYLGLIIRDR
ncbi:MAG: DUF2784 domain-containing protein [Gammaproteobacteria bacterium]|nr:MAG: DUF2784 domain-containing protein [Gammaproteobacteria bacterium]